jgi:hypothetical protein
MPLGRSPPLSSLNQSLYRQPHLTGRLIVFQCPFFFAIFALVNASEIELLLARACAASNSFFFVLLFGPRVVPASLRFFLPPPFMRYVLPRVFLPPLLHISQPFSTVRTSWVTWPRHGLLQTQGNSEEVRRPFLMRTALCTGRLQK